MPLSLQKIKTRATAFSKEWQDKSCEDAETSHFGMRFLMYSASLVALLLALKSQSKSRMTKVVISVYFGEAAFNRA